MTTPPALRAILDAEGLSPGHPPAVEAEAQAAAAVPVDPALPDLRHLPFVTIDEPESRDLDQALFVARDEGDGHVVWYAIADAAAYVRRGTALWEEAVRRGASFYVPELTLPMLPRVLSEGAVSLLPQVERQAVVFRMALDARGVCTGTRIERARIRSRAKLSYAGVQRFYDGAEPIDDPDIAGSLRALAVIGRQRIALADERTVVRYHRRELDLGLADDGRFVVTEDLRLDVERWNEQVSVLCNVEGARRLRAAGATSLAIYRVHPPPEPARVAKLVDLVGALVAVHGLPADWRWIPARESLAAYLVRIPEEGPHARVAAAIHRQAIVSNGEASFDALPGSHHGLGAEVYGRFTAPMREAVGVWLHQELTGVLDGAPLRPDEPLRDRVIASAEAAADRQRALDRAINRQVLDQLLGDALTAGALLPGTAMGITAEKVHVRLDAPPVDVKVYVVHLEQARGDLVTDPVSLRSAGRVVVRVGDAVQVRVVGRDADRDRWELDLVDPEPASVVP